MPHDSVMDGRYTDSSWFLYYWLFFRTFVLIQGGIMKKILVLIMALCVCSVSYGKPPKTYSYTSNYSANTAQSVADIMASRNSVGHFLPVTSGYEGCGSGSTQQQAYNNCCYANSRLQTVDVGYAQGANGKWFCCRRYR